MKVFKFGGTSVKDADAVRNMASIIRENHSTPLVVVVSAMGKTTNALEDLLTHSLAKVDSEAAALQQIVAFHQQIVDDLGLAGDEKLQAEIAGVYKELNHQLNQVEPGSSYDFLYDQTVSLGEILSSLIIAAYLNHNDIPTHWLDARKVIKTNQSHRAARVDWGATQNFIRSNINQLTDRGVVLSQGFIGSNAQFNTTTLGREGSDFTGAIFANALAAESLTIWKDVPGVLNADPKKFKEAQKYDLQLMTVINYNQETLYELMADKDIIIEQRSGNNFQMVYEC